MQSDDLPLFPYDVCLSEDGEGWDVIDVRTQEVVRLSDLPMRSLPAREAEEIAVILNELMRTPPHQRH